jgi:hypothetical protein
MFGPDATRYDAERFPWSLTKISLPNGSSEWEVRAHIDGRSYQPKFEVRLQYEHHARLIFAARDLLEACRETLRRSSHADDCRWWPANNARPANAQSIGLKNGECNCHLALIQAALEKAEKRGG